MAVPVFLFIGLLTINKNLDIQLHDTYFVISNFHLGIFFGLTFGLIGLGYWNINKMNGDLLKSLSWIHVGLTIGGTLLILIFTSAADANSAMQGDYQSYKNINLALSGAIFIFVLSQPIYLINLFTGFYRRKK